MDASDSDSDSSDEQKSEEEDTTAPENPSKEGLYIVIDKRERAIIPFFKIQSSHGTPGTCPNRHGIPYFVEHMTVGDIAVCYRGHILVIIERKTWADLAASMKDGRKANIEKLKSLRETSKWRLGQVPGVPGRLGQVPGVPCHIAYLIEGDAFPKPTKKFCRIPHKNLRAHLDHLAFRDTVHMLYAKTFPDTVARVFELAKNYGTITPSLLAPIDTQFADADTKIVEGGNENSLRAKHTTSDALITSNMWCACQNITNNNAHVFMDKYKLRDLLTGSILKKDIATLKYTSGIMIGVKRADNIVKNAQSAATHAKILAEIPSITLATAKKILEVVPMSDILVQDPVEKEVVTISIANIQKTEKVKVGKASAQKIMKYVNT